MKIKLSTLTSIFLVMACSSQLPDMDNNIKIIDPVFPEPTFPGGFQGFNKYLKENYKWNQGQVTVGGTAYVSFIVLENGEVSDVNIIKGVCETCDKEVLRLIGEMPKWLPAMQARKPIKTKMILPIRFGLTNPYN